MADAHPITLLALSVVEDAIERSAAAPLTPPEHGLRLALAYLWTITLSKNREPFDVIWRGLLGKCLHQGASRESWCRAQLASIRCDVGMDSAS